MYSSEEATISSMGNNASKNKNEEMTEDKMRKTDVLAANPGENETKTGGFETKTVVTSNVEKILSLPLSQLEEIEIVRAPAPPISLKDFGNVVVNDPIQYGIKEKIGSYGDASTMIFGHSGYLGTILITTKSRNGGLSDNQKGKSLKITPLGYQITKEFYSPAYETPEQLNSETPDHRSTIYWNPDVRANEDGEAEISFFAADADTSYTVTIEGITDNGVLIRKTEKIKRDME
jgi:hypothetical protein